MTAWATSTLQVDLSKYAENLQTVRSLIPESCGILAVVKADAYGMGMIPIAKRAVEEGAKMLGVATVSEGVALREAEVEAPILVLVQPLIEQLSEAVAHDLRLVVSDLDTVHRLADVARAAKALASVHCEIDTGMGRQGFPMEDAAKNLRAVTRVSNVDIEGVLTHFPSADTAEDPFTENQLRDFRQLIPQLDREGVPYEMLHAANSAAVINYPQSAFDMVRVGLMAYGVSPTPQAQEAPVLHPVARWTTKVVLVREIPGGASISYGRTYRAPSPMIVAALPIGYANGYPVALSNRADVLIRGVRCPVRGRVTMNETLVDVTKVHGVSPGDVVTLIGEDGRECITAEELAGKAETIPYEIMTGIGPGVAREHTG